MKPSPDSRRPNPCDGAGTALPADSDRGMSRAAPDSARHNSQARHTPPQIAQHPDAAEHDPPGQRHVHRPHGDKPHGAIERLGGARGSALRPRDPGRAGHVKTVLHQHPPDPAPQRPVIGHHVADVVQRRVAAIRRPAPSPQPPAPRTVPFTSST